MKKIILIIITLVLIVNCENSEKPIISCESNNPLEDLPWLKDLKNSLKNCSFEISIFQAEYQNEINQLSAPGVNFDDI